VIPIPEDPADKPETLAPLTDAGLTPYRGMKKLRAAGKLGAGRTVVVNGIGGLGGYGVQYARLLGGGATVVAFARTDDKLALARENGAHHTVNTRNKKTDAVQNELEELTGRRDVDAVLDCAGAEESLALGFSILANEGALTSVGLIGQRAQIPLFPFTSGEKVLLRIVLGQLQRSDRSPRARRPGTHQAQHHPGQFRRHQRQPAGVGPRRHGGSRSHHLRLKSTTFRIIRRRGSPVSCRMRPASWPAACPCHLLSCGSREPQ
jgi:NADPH:quinone reductase-like Zn-dependent oxidoreductase